jgi:hypothetical protein
MRKTILFLEIALCLCATNKATASNVSVPVENVNARQNRYALTIEEANNHLFYLEDIPPYHPDTMKAFIDTANAKVEADYTIPSFTELKRRLTAANANATDSTQDALKTALQNLQSNAMPYNIVMNIYKDPTTKMAFNWFTNANMTGDSLEIVLGNQTGNSSAFNTPLMKIMATCLQTGNLPYAHSRNELSTVTGIPNGATRSYTEHKVLAENLTPNTTYSFRVGKSGAWSEIGVFTTAKTTKEPFSFIYTTDPQANLYDMFDISQRTTHAAFEAYPNVNFWLHTGDLIESSGNLNSEWEWEQLFETQQDLFLKYPFAPIIGNHDNSVNANFTKHFFTDSLNFDRNGATKATTPGSSYCYVYGDVLFFALNFEEYNKAAYMDSLINWMYAEAAKHSDVKWRIAYGHKTLYTGSHSHQSDADGKQLRLKMAPVYDSLQINIAFEAHDHIYEVIGPLKNHQLAPNSVSNQISVATTDSSNMTGKLGGVFDTKNGTLYFLNNSSGKKKYWPRNAAEMTSAESATGIPNYFNLFTGRFGQTGRPTFSNVSVTADTITITTYEVFDNGSTALFDEFKVIKSQEEQTTPVCDTVSNIIISLIQSTSAHVAWTAVEGQSNWQVEYAVQGSSNTTLLQVNNTPSTTLNGLTANTAYQVRARALCGNDSSQWNVAAFTTENVSVQEINESVKITLSPNPTREHITLKAEGIHEKCHITLLSLVGTALLQQDFNFQTSNTMELELGLFSKGIYFVQLQTSQGKKFVQKLVIQ